MGSKLRQLLAIYSCMLLAEAAPWNIYVARQSQACGDQLADIMSLVCSGRGYNVAFRPESSSSRRFRRGIVEECCHKSCSPAMLELYCQADPTEVPPSAQIRKRSDFGLESTELLQGKDAKDLTTELSTKLKAVIDKHNIVMDGSTPAPKQQYNSKKLINLLETTEHHSQRHTAGKKHTPNDTTEEEFFKQSHIPLIRHQKKHHSNARQFLTRKVFTKTKREKNVSGESTQTFAIGTVKPYFAGRALASKQSNYIHHLPLS